MKAWNILELLLFGAELFAKHTKRTGDDKLIGEFQSAVEALRRVQASPVYREQVNKVTMQWPNE